MRILRIQELIYFKAIIDFSGQFADPQETFNAILACVINEYYLSSC